jgi:glycopeptide antibiotics resistance protein
MNPLELPVTNSLRHGKWLKSSLIYRIYLLKLVMFHSSVSSEGNCPLKPSQIWYHLWPLGVPTTSPSSSSNTSAQTQALPEQASKAML